MIRLITFLLALTISASLFSQDFVLASYNCENAFDTIHDEGKNDYEFLPQGNRRWSRKRMFNKLKNIGKVILSIDSVKPADIICLEEVENDTVLTYLTCNTSLARIGYRYVMTSSLDERGIDVAILYSPFTFHLISSHIIRPRIDGFTRDVLHVTGWIAGGDTLDVFAVHLPSKLKGKTSERNRLIIASQIMDCIDSLRSVRSNLNAVIMGDFNDGPGSKVVRQGFGGMTNLMTRRHQSYKYQGRWDCIDQILVNKEMLHRVKESGVATRQFLLEPDERYSGTKPRRTFVGWNYNASGFSDHLPVYLRIGNTQHRDAR